MEAFGQVNSYEAIFFRAPNENKITREMLYAEFEALLDGVVGLADCAGTEVEAIYALISKSLEIRALVFFRIGFEDDGYADPSWNVPLHHLADIAELGPDLGGGPVRIACRGHCNISWHEPQLWSADIGPGSAMLEEIRQAVQRNRLGLMVETQEPAVAAVTTSVPAAHPDSPATAAVATDDAAGSARMNELLQQQVERVHKLSREHATQLDALAVRHREEIGVLQAEVAQLRDELGQAQKLAKEQQRKARAAVASLEQIRNEQKSEGTQQEQQAALRARLESEIRAELAQGAADLQDTLETREAEIAYLKEMESQLREELNEARQARKELLNDGGGNILERLHKCGVVFVAYHPGVGHMPVPLKDLASYVDSPEAYVAAKCNVTEQQYREWRAHWENPVCQGAKATGEACNERVDRVEQPARYIHGKSNLCVVCQSRGNFSQTTLGMVGH